VPHVRTSVHGKEKSGRSPTKAFSSTASESNRKISFSAHVRWCEHGAPVLFLLAFEGYLSRKGTAAYMKDRARPDLSF
jgi:hypothetical protein